MSHPFRWNEGDRCQHGGRSGVIHQIKAEIATVEFDDEPYVMVDVALKDLDLDIYMQNVPS